MSIRSLVAGALAAAIGYLAPAAPSQPTGAVHHAILTASAGAQAAFDRGLALVYAFNFQAAERAFHEAAALDAASPMPDWGLALAEGPNLNSPWPDLGRERAASAAIGTAATLAARLPPSAEAGEEQAYVGALLLRFDCSPRPDYPKVAAAYAAAMGKIAAAYPDDPDAATLYAEALMDEIHAAPRTPPGHVLPRMATVLGILDGILQRWPAALGANHLYIHASEGPGNPARALASARILAGLATHGFAGDGHLLHMPAHVFLRTGDYVAAERAALAAAAADRAYLAANPTDTGYAFGYADHNLEFLVDAAAMDGDYRAAAAAAQELAASAEAGAGQYPAAAALAIAPLQVDVRFGRWNAILDEESSAPPWTGYSGDQRESFHLYQEYARASALAATSGAQPARQAFNQFHEDMFSAPRLLVGVPSLPRGPVMQLLMATLGARLAAVDGAYAFAGGQLRQAVAIEDQFGDRDPPAWYPIGETLGAVLLRAGQAAEAEAALRACLKRWPNDPRALFELSLALRQEGKDAQAASVQQRFHAGWLGGSLSLEDF